MERLFLLHIQLPQYRRLFLHTRRNIHHHSPFAFLLINPEDVTIMTHLITRRTTPTEPTILLRRRLLLKHHMTQTLTPRMLHHITSPFAFPESNELLELAAVIQRVILTEDTIPFPVLRSTLPFRQLLNRLPNLDIMTLRELRHTFTFYFNLHFVLTTL